jgi:hypothetical protein
VVERVYTASEALDLESTLHFVRALCEVLAATKRVANRDLIWGFRVGGSLRGRFATPADFPVHDGTR